MDRDAFGDTHIMIPPDVASLLSLSNGNGNFFVSPMALSTGLLMADGVMLAVRPPSGEKSPYAFGDSIQGSTKKTERHSAR